MTYSFAVYMGNCPKSVNKDAKYAIRSGGSGPVVAVRYITANGETWLATTEEHPELVRIVNSVKTGIGSAPNGPLYINEFGQVIVPVGPDATYYLADEDYDLPLRFTFEGHLLAVRELTYGGNHLSPATFGADRTRAFPIV